MRRMVQLGRFDFCPWPAAGRGARRSAGSARLLALFCAASRRACRASPMWPAPPADASAAYDTRPPRRAAPRSGGARAPNRPENCALDGIKLLPAHTLPERRRPRRTRRSRGGAVRRDSTRHLRRSCPPPHLPGTRRLRPRAGPPAACDAPSLASDAGRGAAHRWEPPGAIMQSQLLRFSRRRAPRYRPGRMAANTAYRISARRPNRTLYLREGPAPDYADQPAASRRRELTSLSRPRNTTAITDTAAPAPQNAQYTDAGSYAWVM